MGRASFSSGRAGLELLKSRAGSGRAFENVLQVGSSFGSGSSMGCFFLCSGWARAFEISGWVGSGRTFQNVLWVGSGFGSGSALTIPTANATAHFNEALLLLPHLHECDMSETLAKSAAPSPPLGVEKPKALVRRTP